MPRLLLDNIEPGTSDEDSGVSGEVRISRAFDEIEHTPGAGSRPAVVLTLQSADPTALGKSQQRIHNMHWKHRKLTTQILRDSENLFSGRIGAHKTGRRNTQKTRIPYARIRDAQQMYLHASLTSERK